MMQKNIPAVNPSFTRTDLRDTEIIVLTARPIPPRHHPGAVLLAVVLPPLHLLHVGGELVFDGAVLHVLQTAVADLAGAGAARRRPLRAGLQLQEDARLLDWGGVVGRETLSVVEGAPSYALEVLPELVHFAGRLRGVDLDRDEFGAGGGRLRVGLPQIGVRRVLDPVHVLQVLLLDVCPAERREGLVPAKDFVRKVGKISLRKKSRKN
jgi:hypothetical protein